MKIYWTNAALGYRESASLIRLGKSEHGYDYLCIGTDISHNSDTYVDGKIERDLEDCYVHESSETVDFFKDSNVFIETKGLSKAKQSPFAAETPILKPV